MTQPTPLYKLVETRLGGPLDEYVAARRATTSWRAMAADLTERTGEYVTHQTLMSWFADRIKVETTVTVSRPAGAA
jgi:hypothetical protein